MTTCTGDCGECKLPQLFEETKEEFAFQNVFEYDFETHSKPLAMMLSVTDDCNLACPYCFVHQNPRTMPLETAREAVEWLKGNYAAREIDTSVDKMVVNFFGGEPLLAFDDVIVPLVEEYHNDVQFGITTNGVLLTPDVIDFFYKYNIQPLLSLDGCREVQNTQRPGKGFNSFAAVLGNLQYLLLRFPDTVMRATLTEASTPYLYENVLMAEELGFTSVTFCPNAFEDWGEEQEELLTEQLTKTALFIYKKLSNIRDYPVIQVDPLARRVAHIEAIMNDSLKFNNGILRCGLGTTSCAITVSGDIIPCQEKTSNPTVILGNVLENGIDSKLHEEFLYDYWDKVNKVTCERHCSERDRVICLSDTCPSRLEDLDYTFSTSHCVFTRVSTRVAARLHFLCSDSINTYINNYFSGGVIC